MNWFGQLVSNWAHVAAVFVFGAFELVCLAYGFYQISRGSSLGQAAGQNALLLAWIGLFSTLYFFLYYRASIPIGETANFFWAWGGWVVLGVAAALGAFLLLLWGKGHPSHVWPVLVKILVQCSLLTVILTLIFRFWDYVGTKILPYFYGVHQAYGNWWWKLPLPGLLNVMLGAAIFLFGAMLYRAGLNIYIGMVSTQGILAMMGLALFVGPSWKFSQAREKWREDLQTMTAPGGTDKVNPVRQAESRYGTRDWNLITFHMLTEDKHGLALTFPGYLVGIEKANRYLIDVDQGPKGTLDAAAEKQKIGKYLGDRKRTFVSHIVEYKQGRNGEMDVEAEFLHNVYAKKDDAKDYDDAYAGGFAALDRLRDTLIGAVDSAAQPYTHILAFCMGWNTDQQEAIRNFNSLRGFVDEQVNASGAVFKPLFVGITWPSQWAGMLPLSYLAKADDADETGLIWANYLLKKVLAPVKKAARKKSASVKLVLVGHSFGTRVLTRALAGDPAWILPDSAWSGGDKMVWKENGADLFVGLQGAFGADRFVEKGVITGGGWEGAPYKDLPASGTRFLFTWSKEDKANPLAAYVTGANHMGGNFGAYLGQDNPEIFRCLTYGKEFKPESGWSADIRKAPDTNRVLMLDVSSIVKDHPYGKGGGAHSDIYKSQIGNVLWQSISTLEPMAARLDTALTRN